MPVVDLKPCPYCGNENLTLVAMGGDEIKRVSVVSTECGAVGPTAAADDPPGHDPAIGYNQWPKRKP